MPLFPIIFPSRNKERRSAIPDTDLTTQKSYDQSREERLKKLDFNSNLFSANKFGYYAGTFFNYFNLPHLSISSTFLKSLLRYSLLPIVVILELTDVLFDTAKIIRAKKATLKHWISLAVNLIKLGGVGFAAGLILAGIAAAGSVLAPVAAAAFVLGYGAKTLWHVGNAIYSVVKSFDPSLKAQQKSDLRHEAFNHTIKAGFTAALTVCAALVITKATLLFSAAGIVVGVFGLIVSWGLMAKDYFRNKKAAQVCNHTKDNDSLSLNHPELRPSAPAPSYDRHYLYQPNSQAPQTYPQTPTIQNDWRNYSSPSFAQLHSGSSTFPQTTYQTHRAMLFLQACEKLKIAITQTVTKVFFARSQFQYYQPKYKLFDD